MQAQVVTRIVIMLCFLSAVITLCTSGARADNWPARPIKIIVPFVAGGNTDSTARLVGRKLSHALGQAVVIENLAGAGANLGAAAAARSPADGYTFLLGTSSTHGINFHLYPKLPYDPVRDFTPVVLLVESMLYLVVNPELPVHSVGELVDYARKHPGKLSFGSVGVGSPHHLAGELLKARAGIDIVHIPYRGSGPSLQDLIAGQIQMAFDATALQLIREQRVSALAVASSKRWPAAPEIPSMAEQGFPDFDFGGWFALFAPAGTPSTIVERVNLEVNAILQRDDLRERLRDLGLEPLGGSSQQLAEYVQTELARYPAIIKASGAKVGN